MQENLQQELVEETPTTNVEEVETKTYTQKDVDAL